MSKTAPNWLTDFPLPMLPDSWDLNPIFLNKLKELQVMWDAAGFEWKFGCELEFSLETVDEATRLSSHDPLDSALNITYPGYSLLQDFAQRAATSADTPDIYSYALEQIRQSFSANPAIDQMLKDTKWTHGDATDHLNMIERNLYSDDAKIIHRARQNVFLAYIHTRDLTDGGLMDMVEPRFGDFETGLGWYDMDGPEIRTNILGSPEDVIESYHKFLHILSVQAPRFGLTLNLTNAHPPQIHISIWRKADQKNMMTMSDEFSTVFCERALRGYYEFMNDSPFMIQDRDIRQRQISMNFSAGTTRAHYIRQESDNWELRRPQYCGVTHMARHLMMVMTGMAYGCLYPARYQEFSQHQPFLLLNRVTHPVVRHRYGAHISGLASALQYATIGNDGYLIPDQETIEGYLERLQEEIGYGNLDQFTVVSDQNSKLVFNLRYASTWTVLFEKIRLTDDNQMDLSALGQCAEIIEAFDAVEITGRRTALKTARDHMQTDAHSTEFALSEFSASTIAEIFFTPYERSEIIRHYTHQARAILRDNANYLVAEIEGTRALPGNVDVTDTALARWFVENHLMDTTIEIDIGDSLLIEFMIYAENGLRIDRSALLKWESYIASMRPHFKAAVDDRIAALQSNPGNEALIHLLTLCRNAALEKPFSIRDTLWKRVEDTLITIGDGRLIDRHGIHDKIFESIKIIPVIAALGVVALAYRDDIFSNHDIAAEIDAAFRAAPANIENTARALDIDHRDPLNKSLFVACATAYIQGIAEIRDWICNTTTYGKRNRLAWQETTQKTAGPELPSGPA